MSIRDVLRKYENREVPKSQHVEWPTPSERERETGPAPNPIPPLVPSNRLARINAWSLDEFEQSGEILRVRSRTLGEDVWFVANRALRKKVPDPTLAAYTAKELRRLRDISPKDLFNIHRLKKTFDGEIEN